MIFFFEVMRNVDIHRSKEIKRTKGDERIC